MSGRLTYARGSVCGGFCETEPIPGFGRVGFVRAIHAEIVGNRGAQGCCAQIAKQSQSQDLERWVCSCDLRGVADSLTLAVLCAEDFTKQSQFRESDMLGLFVRFGIVFTMLPSPQGTQDCIRSCVPWYKFQFAGGIFYFQRSWGRASCEDAGTSCSGSQFSGSPIRCRTTIWRICFCFIDLRPENSCDRKIWT